MRKRSGIVDPSRKKNQHTHTDANEYRQLHVSLISNDHVVPSSTTKYAEKQRERDLAKTADDLNEFYIPMGKAPHFVTDEQLNEFGGKPEVSKNQKKREKQFRKM